MIQVWWSLLYFSFLHENIDQASGLEVGLDFSKIDPYSSLNSL